MIIKSLLRSLIVPKTVAAIQKIMCEDHHDSWDDCTHNIRKKEWNGIYNKADNCYKKK